MRLWSSKSFLVYVDPTLNDDGVKQKRKKTNSYTPSYENVYCFTLPCLCYIIPVDYKLNVPAANKSNLLLRNTSLRYETSSVYGQSPIERSFVREHHVLPSQLFKYVTRYVRIRVLSYANNS